MGLIFFSITIFFCIIAILSSKKIGDYFSSKDLKWIKFIHENLNKMVFMEELHGTRYFLLRNYGKYYVIIFRESWLFEIYHGSSRKEIGDTYSIWGQSNKAEDLTSREKSIGKKIEEWYVKSFSNS